jgi:hypothetical protein
MTGISTKTLLSNMRDKLKEAVALLKTLREDAKLALSGDWDKSEEGFRAQIESIDKFLDSLDKKDDGKFKQTKLDL